MGHMKLNSVLVMSLIFLVGCGDNPYSAGSPDNPSGGPGGGTPPVPPVDPPIFSSVHGAVDIGSPVSGAKVSVHTFENTKIGKELGSSTTDSSGHYRINILERFEGPCLLVSNGGSYVDPTTQRQVLIQEKEILSAPIMGLKTDAEVSINAWTTLAAARTTASRDQYDTDEKAIKANLLLMSNHIKRDAEPEAILKSKAIDIFVSGLKLDDFNLLSHLTHLGLSGLANNHYGVSTAQLISVLAADLSDGQFSNSEDTRSKLVLNIHEAIKNFQKTKKPGFNPSGFLQQNGFFEHLSLDQNQQLYAAKDTTIHPEDILKLPILNKLMIDQIQDLKAFEPIKVSAQIKSPHEVSQIEASLVQVKRAIVCTSDFEKELIATGFSLGDLKTCKVSKEEETPIEIQNSISKNGGQINFSFNGQAGDPQKELTWKVVVTVQHINGSKVPFETEPFSLTPMTNPSLELKYLGGLMHRALAEQELSYGAVLEHLTKLGATLNPDDFKTFYLSQTEKCHEGSRIKEFLKHGISANLLLDNEENSLLSHAILKGCTSIAKVLMESGADIRHKTKNGDTPLKAAIRLDDSSILDALVKRGAKLDDKDDTGKSSLDYAQEQGKANNVKFIRNILFPNPRTVAENSIKPGDRYNLGHQDIPALEWEPNGGREAAIRWPAAQERCPNKGDGWRLPSLHELSVLCRQRNVLGKDAQSDDAFWSSTQNVRTKFYMRFSDDCHYDVASPDVNDFKIRCVRNL